MNYIKCELRVPQPLGINQLTPPGPPLLEERGEKRERIFAMDGILNFQRNIVLRFKNYIVFKNLNVILYEINELHKM